MELVELVEFLRRMLDADEQVALEALDLPPMVGEWRWARVSVSSTRFSPCGRHHPARVLREVEAKRRILNLHREGGRLTGEGYGEHGFAWCETCGSGEPHEYPTKWPCSTLKLLALPYADHPDYRDEWKP